MLQARWGVEAGEAQRLAHLAGGRLGWAVNAVAAPDVLEERDAAIGLLHQALGGSRVTRFGLADKLARKPDALPDLLQTWLTWWRDLALLALGTAGVEALTNIDHLDHLRRVAAAWPQGEVVHGLKQTHTALWQLERNANTRLVVENLLLAYPLPQTPPPAGGA
jgi:DNA polymerase-3 subunit delta'